MRFSHFLKYNAVPEWQNHYMDYNDLKNLIYTLQTDDLKKDDELSNGKNNKFKNLFKKKKKNKNSDEEINNGTSSANNNNSNNNGDSPFDMNNDMYMPDPGTIELQDFNTISEYPQQPPSPSQKKNGISTKVKRISSFKKARNPSISDDESSSVNTYDAFINALTTQRDKVDDFYKRTEEKLYEKFDNLTLDLQKNHIIEPLPSELPPIDMISEFKEDPLDMKSVTELRSRVTNNTIENISSNRQQDFSEEDFDYDDLYTYDTNQENTALLNYNDFNIDSQKKSLLKQSIINLYIDLCQLKSFIELNSIGFSKITKKADKVLHLNTRPDLIETGEFYLDIYTFSESTLFNLNNKISQLIDYYAIITNQSMQIEEAKQELKSYLHDHIVWERSNTWKDMLGLLSQTSELNQEAIDAEKKKEKLSLQFYTYPLPFTIPMGKLGTIENFQIPKLFFTWKAYKIAFIILFTGLLLGIKTLNDRIEGRCLALVECCAFLWALEAIPLFATAFLVPLLVVLFKVLRNDDGSTMGAKAASSRILSTMWSSTIMILIAGFTLSEALAQYDIANVLASWLLAIAGTRPANVLLMAMGIVFFLSMWISNVASPVLTYSLLKPVLDELDADVPFAKALVMGVALAADVGGMASPISSPQNVISMQYLAPYGIGWGQFFAVALPVGIITTLSAWLLMCVTFKINKTKLKKFTPIRTRFTLKQYFIIFVTLGTILLWCVESQIEGAFGASGEIAVLPIVLFFGTGLLSTNDLNTFPWSIVILAMGGVALGDAVSSSGLLKTIATSLQKRIENDGVMAILCIFGVLMLVIGTFVSHTVSAIIIIPLVQKVGDSLPDLKASPILVFGCALMASCGMGLPSSGFPNVTAISMVDKKGKRYLSVGEFITRGVPASLIGFVWIITVGYGIMTSILKPRSPGT